MSESIEATNGSRIDPRHSLTGSSRQFWFRTRLERRGYKAFRERIELQCPAHKLQPGVEVFVLCRDFILHNGVKIMKLRKNGNVRDRHVIENKLFPRKQLIQGSEMDLKLVLGFFPRLGCLGPPHSVIRMDE